MRPPHRARNALPVLVVILGMVMVACTDAPLAPPTRVASTPPRSDVLPVSGHYDFPTPATSAPDTGGSVVTGITVPAGLHVRIRYHGFITARKNPGCDYPAADPASYPNDGLSTDVLGGPVPLTTAYTGGWSQTTTMTLFYPATGGVGNVQWANRSDGTGELLAYSTDAYPIGASVVFLRGAIDVTPDNCYLANGGGETFSYSFEGTRSADVDFLRLHITASAPSVVQGQSVHFTFAAEGYDPAAAYSRQWMYFLTDGSNGSVTVAACANQPTCDFAPASTGTMTVVDRPMSTSNGDATVNVTGDTVQVIKCPTGDALLDSPAFRKALLDAVAASNFDSSKTSGKRREQGGFVFKDRTTGAYTFKFVANTLAYGACAYNGSANPLEDPPNADLVATYHTHPATPGEPNILCEKTAPLPGSQDSVVWTADYVPGGPAPDDVRTQRVQNLQKPDRAYGKTGYIIDKRYVYRYDPQGVGLMQLKKPWDTAACRWR